jgi:hypothetical protein
MYDKPATFLATNSAYFPNCVPDLKGAIMRFLISLRHALDQFPWPAATQAVYLLFAGAAVTLVALAAVAVVVCV